MARDPSTPTPSPEDAGVPDDKPKSVLPGSDLTTFVYDAGPPVPAFDFTHDKEKRLSVLTWPDGRTERFRDNPARQLVVEFDRKTGEPRPVTTNGRPVYMYLCREEREIP
jgi:hypothetical protein